MLAALVVVVRSLALVCRGHRAVAFENLALRQQLAVFQRTQNRPPLRPSDRLFWVVLSRARNWRAALVIVQPGTVVRWHRQWLRHRWTQRSSHTRRGRPSTDAAIRALVEEMRVANPLWGAPRIHGELKKLGIDVSERTVSRLLRRRLRPPSQTWRTFLTNHLTSLVSMDFFTYFIGRHDLDHVIGWSGEFWRKFDGKDGQKFPPVMGSYIAVKVYGPGHVIAYNYVATSTTASIPRPTAIPTGQRPSMDRSIPLANTSTSARCRSTTTTTT